MAALSDRRALVTGASSGIGAATAAALSAAGAQVWLAGRDRARLEQAAARCPGAHTLLFDVRDWPALSAALEPLSFDIVVNNAGLALGIERLPEGDPSEWRTVLDTNVLGVLHVARATLPAMRARGQGDHVLIGSVAGRHSYPGGSIYCASKAAVRSLYETLRLDLAGSGVRFTTVDPGMVETPFSRTRFRGDEQRAAAVYAGVDPLTPSDVADAVLWALTRPPHVNVGEIVLWASAQASVTQVARRPL